MRAIKVVWVIDSLYGGGAEKAVLTLSRCMNRLGHLSYVVSLSDTVHYDTTDERNLHIVRMRARNALGSRSLGRRVRALRRVLDDLEAQDGRPADRVIANLWMSSHVVARSNLENAYYCVRTSIEQLSRQVRERSFLRSLGLREKLRALEGKHLITISRGLQRELEYSPTLCPASVRTIYDPLETDRIRRWATEPTLGIPDGEYLIHVGRAARAKRHDVLLEAFKKVPRRFRLVLRAGRSQRLRRWVAEHGLADRVIIPGFQQNPYPWIARARLLLLSSAFEGLSNVCIEALACGTPVVSTDCPHGPSEILTGELSRWLVPVGDSDALATRINEALVADIGVSRPEILDKVRPELIAAQYAALARH